MKGLQGNIKLVKILINSREQLNIQAPPRHQERSWIIMNSWNDLLAVHGWKKLDTISEAQRIKYIQIKIIKLMQRKINFSAVRWWLMNYFSMTRKSSRWPKNDSKETIFPLFIISESEKHLKLPDKYKYSSMVSPGKIWHCSEQQVILVKALKLKGEW